MQELVDQHLDLASAAGAGEQRGKMLTLIASLLVRGECIDDADVLCAGGRTVRFTLTLARP